MSVPDAAELDRLFSLWKDALWKTQGITASEAENNRKLYRYRITSIDQLDANSLEVHVEFAPNAVYGIEHLPGSKASIVIPPVTRGEINAPPEMAHLLTEFIASGGIRPGNFIGTDADGAPRVLWN
ncbi:hypothetical protein [Rhodococcus sp. CH91]|uniref:hypothetical protein n=1 Tax=Rhodococcus sp. CH91 TaxID=2910256 RepID=UPI001F4B7491|nr:hypothetical protein [Rhodococcus sp. CH91]